MPNQTDHIVFGLGRIAALLRAGQWQAGSGAGLNPTQAEILSRVAARPMRSGDLATHLGVSFASLSDSVSALVAKGLVERLPDPDDRRARRIVLTNAGAAMAAGLPVAPLALTGALDALPPTDRASLLRLLVTLIRSLQEASAIPTQRICVTCVHFRPNFHDDAARPHHCAFVDAAFGDAKLRLDCRDHEAAPAGEAAANWQRFIAA